MSGLAKIFANLTLKKKGQEITQSSLSGKIVWLYFSASWCPPCRGFTPQLIEFYNKHSVEKNFEVVFVTWDEEEEDYEGYYGKMPWATVGFIGPKDQQRFNDLYKVESIPTLIGIDADSGDVVSRSARTMVVKDPEAAHYPWRE
eukprot:CAMPEP_0176445148 /NCGR_PEP_ID=MMETSP0127-20121128/23506_1 /TAXON_ID=938130 /ORGANISM="Platyophrya macrostoma, Strain WH" /LENGTH=143 /DNA_ID=CAMNT_0017830833 /DNA_START=51 /DNA_END=482 /DNA_ORIENTATION=+